MNASFLLALAAHRHDQCSRGETVTAGPLQPAETTSDSFVVSIEALQQARRPGEAHSAQSNVPAAGASSAVLREPPAAARPHRAQAELAATGPGPDLNAISISSSSSTSCVPQECRICLAADSAEELIQPCSCCGTLAYTHMSCLKTWVQERGSLMCELCGQRYREPYVQVLEPLAAAAARHKHGHSIASAAPAPHETSKGEWCALL